MAELRALLDSVQGSAIGLSLAGICVLALLLLRRFSADKRARRRALVAILLFLLFVLLQLPLLLLEATVPGPDGQPVANPLHLILHVLGLAVFALAMIQGFMLLLVELLLEGRLKMQVPHILSDAITMGLFVISVFVILYARNLNVTGLFTTAGVLSIVLGLALQDTLGNFFAGLALQTERPYQVKDWVSFADFEGTIEDVSWRSTQLRTRNNDIVTVPNSSLAKETFVNHSRPSRISGRLVDIGVAYRHPPAEVKRVLLAACGEVPEILATPRPLVRLKSFNDFSISYEVKFWIKEYDKVPDIEEAFRTVVWYALRRHEIEIPFPIQYEYQIVPPTKEEEREEAFARILERLRGVDFLSPLSDEELRTLAKRAKLHAYHANETICRQDDEGDSFFLLDEGRVAVSIARNGRREEVARLEPPAFFGEMALCTGQRRTATVQALDQVRLLVIDRETFRDVIYANPELANGISEILARRQMELERKRLNLEQPMRPEEMSTLQSRIKREIWRFLVGHAPAHGDGA